MRLTIVGLPIGNVEDMSPRAIRTLQECRFVVCEDTRMFNNLWSKLVNIGMVSKFEGKLRFVNDFNEYRVLPNLLNEMNTLEEAVLISDAGMPLISDPGYKLVSEGLALGWEVNVVPGPTAESAALAVSGLPTDKYMFLGFLPKKPGKRNETLKNMKSMSEFANFSVVIYESSIHIQRLLEEIANDLGEDLKACVCVDLTKVSEKIFRGTVQELIEKTKTEKIKGEVTLILSLAK